MPSYNLRNIQRSDSPISPTVITSKAAENDLQNIRMRHADLVMGISNQAQRVDEYRRQKAAEDAAMNATKAALDKEKMTANTQTQKDALDFATKNAELDIKRAALSQ